jgi:hypothetical protein
MAGNTQITTGSFTNVASTPFFIAIPNQINLFRLWNLTMSGQTALGIAGNLTSTRIVEGLFNPQYMGAGTGIIKQNGTVSGVLAPLNNGAMTINGFTIFNAANNPPGKSFTISSFTQATNAVFTTSAPHGFVVGDIVRVTNLTSALQFSGLAMTVIAVSSTTFTTLLDSTGSTTSAGTVQKIGNNNLPNNGLYFPENRVIAKITNANPMVITTLVAQNYQPGDVVTFDISSAFGVPQLSAGNSGLPFQATVSSSNNAVGTQTVTFANVDSTNFGVFATNSVAANSNPTHWLLAGAYPFTFPQMVPQGEGNLNALVGITPSPLPYGNQDVLAFTKQNLASNGILIGTGDGTNNATTGGIIGSTVDAWMWEAVTSEQVFP